MRSRSSRPARLLTRGVTVEVMGLNLPNLLISAFAGLAIFIFGMHLMSDGLQKTAGEKMKTIIRLFARNRFVGLLAGAGVTAVIQSSSATTVMVIGFINAGLLNLAQSIGIIFGTNIGTTVTAQIVSFNVSTLAMPAIIAGLLLFFIPYRNCRGIGETVLGFGFLFYGMVLMSDELTRIADFPTVTRLFSHFDCTPLDGVMPFGAVIGALCIGLVVTMIIQSSSASTGIIIALGAILWLTTTIISIIFVMRYAKKVKADKGSTFLSLQEQQDMMNEWGMTDSEAEAADGQDMAPKMTGRQKATLIVFALTFVIMIVSFIPWADLGVTIFDAGATTQEVTTTVTGEELVSAYDEANGTTTTLAAPVEATSVAEEEVTPAWSSFLTGVPLGSWYFDEASTWFLLMALIIGVIGGVSESRFVKAFINGAADMMSVVLIIALARSITVLMAKTGLDMWILNNAAAALTGMSAIIFAPLSFLLYIVLSFLIPSSSGMATVSMPIMGGLASQLNFSVETMVMIYSAGNGLVNLFTPTSGAIMGGLALAKVEYSTWLKFGAKLFVVLGVVCIVILTAAMVILS